MGKTMPKKKVIQKKALQKNLPKPTLTKKKTPPKSKFWIVVINNPTPEDMKIKLNDKMTYMIFAKEHFGENEGTPHLQGFVCFKNRVYRTQVSKVFPRANLMMKSAKSTLLECSDYCKKDDEYVEYGELSQSRGQLTSARNKHNWELAFSLAKEGRMDEIEPELLVRFYHAFKRIQQDHPRKHKDLDHTCGVWITGPTGVGKSRKARHDYPDFYDKPLNKWWDGYTGEKQVLLDDVDPSQGQWIGPFMKRWTDHYAFPAEQKGTTVQIRPEEVVVTSQHTIAEVFADSDQKLIDALERRFRVITMEEVYMPPMQNNTTETHTNIHPVHMDESPDEPRMGTVTPELTLSESFTLQTSETYSDDESDEEDESEDLLFVE